MRPYMPLACKSFFDIANPKVQYSKFKLQSLPIIKVKAQCSKVKVKVPTCVRVTRHVSHIDNQRLTPCVPITAILHDNLTHFTAQYGPFRTLKWLRLRGNMGHIAKQCYGDGDVFVIDGALGPLILLHNRTQKMEYRRTPTLLTLNLIL